MRISDWSSDVCSSDLFWGVSGRINYALTDEIDLVSLTAYRKLKYQTASDIDSTSALVAPIYQAEQDTQFSQELQLSGKHDRLNRSEEHTSELQSLMRISYAVFCLKKKKKRQTQTTHYRLHIN